MSAVLRHATGTASTVPRRKGPYWLLGLVSLVVFGGGLALGDYFAVRTSGRTDTGTKQVAVGKVRQQWKGLPLEKGTMPIQAWDPKSPLAKVLSSRLGGERIVAVAKLVEQTPDAGLGHLIEQAAVGPYVEARPLVYTLAYGKWGADEPQGALRHAYSMALRIGTYGNLDTAFLDNVFASWAGRDPGSAFVAAMGLDRAHFRSAAAGAVLATWVQHDARAALSAAMSLPPNLATEAMPLLFRRWALVDPMAALLAANDLAQAAVRQVVQATIIETLADTDASLALRVLLDLPLGQQSPALYNDIFSAWARKDAAAALAAAQTLPAGNARSRAVAGVFQIWAEADPLSAMKEAQMLAPGHDRNQAIEDSFIALARQDPAGAAVYAASLQSDPNRVQLLATLAQNWAQMDPAAALAWTQNNLTGAAYDAATKNILDVMAVGDVAATLQYIGQLPEGPLKSAYLQSALGTWAANDPQAAFNWLDQNEFGAIHDISAVNMLRQLSKNDPVSAASYLASMPLDALLPDDIFSTVIGAYGAQDAPAALQWVQNFPDIPDLDRSASLQGIVRLWSRQDPAATAAYISQYATDLVWQGAFEQVSRAWANQDPGATLAWTESLPAGATRDASATIVVRQLGSTDPAGAWAMALNLSPNSNSDSMYSTIMSSWAIADPTSAITAAAALPEGATRINVFGALAGSLAGSNVNLASDWISTIPPGAESDAAIAGFVRAQVRQNPQVAYAMAIKTSDASARFEVVHNTLVSWARTDPTAAATALQTAPVSEDQRQFILGSMQPRPPASGPFGPGK